MAGWHFVVRMNAIAGGINDCGSDENQESLILGGGKILYCRIAMRLFGYYLILQIAVFWMPG